MALDGVQPVRLRVDGGMAANDWLMQFLSDVLDMPVDRPRILETTALGAAMFAGLADGAHASLDDMAASISTGYAMGAFKKSLGQSINGYLNQLRLHHAKVALIDRGEKVITVALDSGFGSLSRFYEVFIADTGKTPQQFRREHQRQWRD